MTDLTPYEAELWRTRIEWVIILGALIGLIAGISTEYPFLMDVGIAFAASLLVFEGTIHLLANWWFG